MSARERKSADAMTTNSVLDERLKHIAIFRTLRLRLDTAADGVAKLIAPYDPIYNNTFDRIHGGLLTTLADTAAYVAVLTLAGIDAAITTTDLTIRFLAPCRSDITDHATIIKFGRTLCPVAVELHDLDGVLVVAQVTYLRMGGLRKTNPN